MKRTSPIVAVLLILSLAGLVGYAIWPKYGICLETSRYDEIACVARRNLHLGPHFSWSFSRFTVEAVMAEVSPNDIPVLAEMIGDKRSVLRMLAATILADLGEDGLASLKRAAESDNFEIRHTAKIALMDHEINNPDPGQQE